MIVFEDEKIGEVIIYEHGEPYDPRSPDFITASVVGHRSIKRGEVRLLKNRYGPLEDYEMEQFVLRYEEKEPVFDPIESRFDILDL